MTAEERVLLSTHTQFVSIAELFRYSLKSEWMLFRHKRAHFEHSADILHLPSDSLVLLSE